MTQFFARATVLVAAVFLLSPDSIAGIMVSEDDWTSFHSSMGEGLVISPLGDSKGWDGAGDNGFEISWEISVSGTQWSYKYTISGEDGVALSKELSHFILQISDDNKDLTKFSDFSPAPSEGPKLFTKDDGNSNPELPSPPGIWGIKWNTPNASTFTVSFNSEREPVWGNFYAKDGTTDSQEVYAYNAGLGSSLPNVDTTDFTNWIATPNGSVKPGPDPGVVPEPTTLAIWSVLGVSGIAATRRKRLKQS